MPRTHRNERSASTGMPLLDVSVGRAAQQDFAARMMEEHFRRFDLMDLSLEANEGEVACVRVAGRIVQERLSAVGDPLAELLGEGAYGRRVLLNMEGATFIDSSGVGWLLKSHRTFREGTGRLVLHSIPPIVSNVLRVMRLETVLCIQPDEQAALGAAKETAS